MLIRSQDKERIYNLNTITGLSYMETSEYKRGTGSTDHHGIFIIYGGVTDNIGTYSTKENAMTVLDNIIKAFTDSLWTDEKMIIANRICFEMPQDCKVKYYNLNHATTL